jgi:hypothetical protein
MPPRKWGLVGLGMAGLCLVLAALGRSVDGALVALLPLFLGLAALINLDGGFRLDVTATGLRDSSGRVILFTNLREVRALVPAHKPRPLEFLIEVVHAGGALVTPRYLTVRCEELYTFLRDQLKARQATLPPALTAFANEQRATFGAERVWSWGKRAGAPRSPTPGLRAWWIGGLATSVAWLAAPSITHRVSSEWRTIGVIFLILFGIFAFADFISRRGTGTVAPIAGLVISPAALALQLGDLQGQLTWEEIQGVTYPAVTTFLAARGVPNAIAVDVAGARILITDSFTHPLNEIHERILRNWRPV